MDRRTRRILKVILRAWLILHDAALAASLVGDD